MHLRTIFSSYTVCHLSNIQQQYQLQLLHGLLSHLQEVVQAVEEVTEQQNKPKSTNQNTGRDNLRATIRLVSCLSFCHLEQKFYWVFHPMLQ